MTESAPVDGGSDETKKIVIGKRRLALYKAALKRAMRRIAAYRRRLRPVKYGLKEYDRMRVRRFNPAFLFPDSSPMGQRVMAVLPHHHEAAKLGGLVRMLIAPDAIGRPQNAFHIVVVMPSHRGISVTPEYKKREDLIDAVNKEALDWAHVIGLDLGVATWGPFRRLRNPRTDLPPETAYARRRVGDMFIYGPGSGAYRFFNAWRTYDSGEGDHNRQQVAAEDQREFNALIREEDPDIVLLPDKMDSHPSHRTTREIVMEALRVHLAERDAGGSKRTVTLMEYASFHLLTPPRYNLWAVAPKDIAQRKTEANRVFRLQKHHDYEIDQMMAERVISIGAGDEFSYMRRHPGESDYGKRLPQGAPAELPSDVTAENFTVSVLRVVTRSGVSVVRETRVTDPLAHFLSMPKRVGGATA